MSRVPKALLRPDIFADEQAISLAARDILDRAAASAGNMDHKR